MNTKTKAKAVVFISMLVLVFSTVACKQSGEAEKPVKVDEAVSSSVEEDSKKVDEMVDNATEEINKNIDEIVDNATEEVNKNIDDASKKIGGAFGTKTEE